MIKLESYNLDTLRKLIRTLQAENKTLRELLAEKQDEQNPNKNVLVDNFVGRCNLTLA